MATGPLLQKALEKIPGPVTLEMSGVTFIDSSGLRILLQRRRQGTVRSEACDQVSVAC
jgi:anti-anti-sigma factor